MARLRSLLSWLDNNLLFGLSVFLLAFIPLFPKIPLFDIIPGYIVKVRPEDFLVCLTAVVWLKDVVKKRINWNTSIFWLVCLYAVAGTMSVLSGIFLLNTVPLQLLHIGKTGLNLARYLEYFSLFFFVFASLRTKKQIYIALTVVVLTLVGVVIYGVGQEFAHFPVYSTMNREYSKGETLYLQAGARPQSTFAGHYDLAAYLVIILPLIFSLSLGGIKTKTRRNRILIFLSLQLAHLMGLIMLILTGSKTSMVGYGLGMLIVLGLAIFRLPSQKQRLTWIIGLILTGILTLSLGWIVLPTSLKTKVLSLTKKFQSASDKPADLVGTGYEPKTVATTLADGSTGTTVILQKDTWSANALKYGLSMGIRLDTLWPQALLGLARNPLNGASYGTLSALDSHAFAEADSTDNNFLRTIGETGILGFICFYGIVLYLLKLAFGARNQANPLGSTLAIGLCGSTIGLLFSAAYLDVFAASKVAFTFWAVSALVMKSSGKKLESIERLTIHFKRHWPIYLTTLLAFFLLHQNPFMDHNQTKNIEMATSGLEQLTHARCFLTFRTLNLCRNSGIKLPVLPTPYSVLLIPFMLVLSNVDAFYYLNLLLVLGVLVASYIYLRSKANPKTLFVALLLPVILTVTLRLLPVPFTNLVFLLVVVGFPALIWAVTLVTKKIQTPLFGKLGALVVFTLVLLYLRSFVTKDFTQRFRNLAATPGYDAVQLDNGNVIPDTGKRAYLITAMNPYFNDLYTYNHFTALPLSLSQPYAGNLMGTWGIPQTQDLIGTYNQLLSGNNVYLSDYGIWQNPSYLQSFKNVKQAFDLHYVALGCKETCDVLKVTAATPNISADPISPFNDEKLVINQIPASYQFAILSNRFDTTLSPTAFGSDSEGLIAKLNQFKTQNEAFVLVSGDAIPNTDPFHANTLMSATHKLEFPILYSAGNNDLFSKKSFDGDFQSFFTKTDFFILANPDGKSHIDTAQQLKLYDAFLKLEKLSQIKNVFIIAHDLNWQDRSDKDNLSMILENKLKAFPNLHAYIISADHAPESAIKDRRFITQESQNGKITYLGSLLAGTKLDTYLQVSVDATGTVNISPKLFGN